MLGDGLEEEVANDYAIPGLHHERALPFGAQPIASDACDYIRGSAQLKERKVLVPAIRSRHHDLMLDDFGLCQPAHQVDVVKRSRMTPTALIFSRFLPALVRVIATIDVGSTAAAIAWAAGLNRSMWSTISTMPCLSARRLKLFGFCDASCERLLHEQVDTVSD